MTTDTARANATMQTAKAEADAIQTMQELRNVLAFTIYRNAELLRHYDKQVAISNGVLMQMSDLRNGLDEKDKELKNCYEIITQLGTKAAAMEEDLLNVRFQRNAGDTTIADLTRRLRYYEETEMQNSGLRSMLREVTDMCLAAYKHDNLLELEADTIKRARNLVNVSAVDAPVMCQKLVEIDAFRTVISIANRTQDECRTHEEVMRVLGIVYALEALVVKLEEECREMSEKFRQIVGCVPK